MGVIFLVYPVTRIKEAEIQSERRTFVLILVAAIIVLAAMVVALGIWLKKIQAEKEFCRSSLKRMVVSDAADKLFSQYSYIPEKGLAADNPDEENLLACNFVNSDEQQKSERANRDCRWGSAEYGDPSGAQPEDE